MNNKELILTSCITSCKCIICKRNDEVNPIKYYIYCSFCNCWTTFKSEYICTRCNNKNENISVILEKHELFGLYNTYNIIKV